MYKAKFIRSAFCCQADKILLYFHRLHQARMVADVEGRRLMKAEARRVREKVLFTESLSGVEV